MLINVAGGAAATIYSDNGVTTKANPMTTDSFGRFDFFVADGRYDIQVTGTGITTFTQTNVEISDDLLLAADKYRFVSDGGNDTNDGASWQNAKKTVASACASLPSQDSTCTLTSGFGTIFIAPGFSGTLPSCFSSVTDRCPALTVIGPGLHMVNSSIKTYGTVILGTTNSGYTFLQDGKQMVLQSGGPRAAGAILADSTFTLPDAAEGTSTPQSGELAAFVGSGVVANKVLISGGLNTSVSGGILKDSGLSATGGKLTLGSVTFSVLGAETNGTQVYCSDCTIANPCASGGTGAFAKRINATWICN